MILEWDDAERLVRGRECHREGVGLRSARSVLPSRMSSPVVPTVEAARDDLPTYI